MDENYLIYKDGKQITLDAALAMKADVDIPAYVPVGPFDRSNPRWCIGILTVLRDTKHIDNFAYIGQKLPEAPIVDIEAGKFS